MEARVEARTASGVAAVGTTSRSSAGRRTVSTTRPAILAATSVPVSVGRCLRTLSPCALGVSYNEACAKRTTV